MYMESVDKGVSLLTHRRRLAAKAVNSAHPRKQTHGLILPAVSLLLQSGDGISMHLDGRKLYLMSTALAYNICVQHSHAVRLPAPGKTLLSREGAGTEG